MSKTNSLENSILLLLFNATPIADLAADDQTSPATTLTVSLHTADPGEGGSMTTNEATYTSYARVTVNRNSGGWTVTGNSVSPAADITFPECTGGTNTITHFGIGTGVSNNLMYKGTVTPNIAVSTGVVAILDTTSTITED